MQLNEGGNLMIRRTMFVLLSAAVVLSVFCVASAQWDTTAHPATRRTHPPPARPTGRGRRSGTFPFRLHGGGVSDHTLRTNRSRTITCNPHFTII